MKTIILVRHAKSSWADNSLSDFDRPLNKRGKHDAPFMANLLFEKQILPDEIFSSPALRAFSTAQIFAERFNFQIKKICKIAELYGATIDDFISVIRKSKNSSKNIMIFSHNPGITTFTNIISDSYIDNIPTTGISVISFDVDQWKMIEPYSGKLESFEFPKKYLR